jgi:uncharacterized protein (TIGR02147 family)
MSGSLSVFEFWDYKAYLRGRLTGTQTSFAQALRCQPAYVNRVLRGEAHLSSDQAYLASKHLGHSADERRYFLHLVLHNRAGSVEIQNHYRAELQAMRHAQLELKRRVPLRQPLQAEHQAVYYSQWLHAAVHLALTLPNLTQVRPIAAYLGVKPEAVSESLTFLCAAGLAEKEKKRDGYRVTQAQVHLDPASPLISRHHANWRLMAIRQLENPRPESFHYSSVVSLSEQDVFEVQRLLTEAIERIRERVRKSPAEHVACYAMDFFTLGA